MVAVEAAGLLRFGRGGGHFDLKAGVYFGLGSLGGRIWALIQEPKTVAQIKDAILREYDVEPGQCERDVLALLQELVAENLIEITTETQRG